VRVCCEGSGSHFTDPHGEAYHDDTCLMLAKTERGVLIKIRIDMISERPSVTCTYQLQGTKGVYESARSRDGIHRFWLEDLCKDKASWRNLDEIEDLYLPNFWLASTKAGTGGHGGSDYHTVRDFLTAIRGQSPWCSLGIHEAMDMTITGLISQMSIEQEGAWLAVPNSRDWH